MPPSASTTQLGPSAQARPVDAAPAPRRGERWLVAGALAVLAFVCCTPLVQRGWFDSHEQLRPVARALAAYQEIAAGDLYPRWISSGYLGKGMPLFNFYPPAYSFLVAYLRAAGIPIVLAAKLVVFALFLAGGAGAWLWIRPHLGRAAAFVGAVLYLYAPYHFVDVYVRGAMAEFASLAALPFVFAGIDRLLQRSSPGRAALVAAASAGVVVSHFVGAMMIAPFAAVYAVARAVATSAGWRGIGRVAVGAVAGAALSAPYWLPAIVERSALEPGMGEALVSGYYSPFLHFVHPWQWLDPSWGFGDSVPDPGPDAMSFQIGLVVAAAVVASVLALRWLPRAPRSFVLLALALAAAALWFTTRGAAPVYAALASLQLVQFPWRFLGPATLFLAAGGAAAVRVAEDRAPRAAAIAGVVVTVAAVLLSIPHRSAARILPVSDDASVEQAVAADPWSARFGNVDEFLPRGADVEVANGQPGGPTPGGVDVEIGAVEASRTAVTFDVTAGVAGGLAVVPWHAFPGWKVTVDGRPWQLAPGPYGFVAFRVPEGRHVARVRLGTTPPRAAGWGLAAAALAGLAAAALRDRALRRARRAG